jgi:hypothetical protein
MDGDAGDNVWKEGMDQSDGVMSDWELIQWFY